MSAAFRLIALLGLAGAVSCASLGSGSPTSFNPATSSARASHSVHRAVTCSACTSAIPLPPELTRAIETRLSELAQRGGVCSQYAEVLERSYRDGRITLRPYMWRVGGRLVSGQARPNGDMLLAREIDSLNVGVRTVDDVLWSVEHEAAHVAFRIDPGAEPNEDRANRYVRACRSEEASG